MPLESTIKRLAETKNFARKAEIRKDLTVRLQGKGLRKLQNVVPERSERLRGEILGRIAHPELQARFSDARSAATPSRSTLLKLRNQLMARLAMWQPEPKWHRAARLVSIAAVLMLIIRLTPTFFIAPPLQAESEYLLIPMEGFVSVTKGAEWHIVDARTELNEAQSIRTGMESSSTIVLNDTVLRLGENTEINLLPAAFDADMHSPIARVIYGQVWLTSLLPEALSSEQLVILPQGTVRMKEGSVDMLADPQQSTVHVFHRFARVQPTGSEEAIHLIQGDQLTLLPESDVQRHLITENLRSSDWARTNLERDAVHRMQTTAKKQKNAEAVAGILPGSAFYTLKRGSEKLDVLMTLSSRAREEKKIQHAQTRLHEAVALLKAGKSELAEDPLAEYREEIQELASLSAEEARALLSSSLIASSTAVASVLPHSELYPAKKAVLEAVTETDGAKIALDEVDLYLLSDALLGIEELIAEGEITKAVLAFNGIEGAVASVLSRQELGETKVEKDTFKVVKTILRSIAFQLKEVEGTASPAEAELIAALQEQVEKQFPETAALVALPTPVQEQVCMSAKEVMRRTNEFLSSVYTYQTSRGQRNAVLNQIAKLPDCPESARILSRVMNKVPVFTRSFVWDALQKTGDQI